MIYYHQESLGERTHNVSNTTLAECAEFKFLNNLVVVVNLRHSLYNHSVPIHINRSSINPPAQMAMLPLNAFSSREELLNYISENRTKRNYNHNPKHGENGKGIRSNKYEEVSPLECSIAEATLLLKYAVSTRTKNELYVFDADRNKYIIYKAESLTTYHGYHPINQNEIPQKVKEFLKDIMN